ncbi:unnamed protein product [Alopecurus aequalis]
MPLHHRRILFSYDDADDGACDPSKGCASPPSPPPPTPSPSPSPYSYFPIAPCPSPYLAPAPSPARHPTVGRRDQGETNAYSPPPVAATDAHHRRFVTNVLAASAAVVFLSLILLGVSVAVRHRNLRRRRRQAILATAPAATTNVGNDDPEGGGGGGGVVHHVWHIKTVGLDQTVIDSIAATQYRAGAGLLGAADCSVCLGEFSDGELVRLLPKCGHAFHVPCIDTWLRAHVNCPLCRSDVIDPAAERGVDSNSSTPADPDANANAASDSTLEHQDNEETDDQEGPPPRVEEDQHEQELSSPEPLPQLPCPLPRDVRRAASMDAATVSTAADVAALDRLPEAAPEGEQSDRVKDRTGTDGHTASTDRLAYGAPPRFFFSRHCRARSSVLPL